ncbi:unnamed protein product [Rotaria sp. Silwood2]|nr:unnamed protein product [Rotaria sp. Silwood2]CAF3009690.1 unnamed protein product [Rotaria sp. Silwood2]CAF3229971.1 unnamed protein product [Rotaria sp. Silwood2]CAF4183715.1 unnamed protein product [Rotaria sp. Silwood2]CAF4275252.1 unnamed protein product [Rotaria sp. Silwood2]
MFVIGALRRVTQGKGRTRGELWSSDISPSVIALCRKNHSKVPGLSFVEFDATKHFPFPNESFDIVLCIEATHLYGGPQMIDRFVHEVARVLRPDGLFLWCDICYYDGSKRSIDYLTASGELLSQDKVDITSYVLHSLDITSKFHEEVIKRIIPSEQQEAYRVWAGLPGTIMYENMCEGRMDYWRAVFRKKAKAAEPATN